MSDPVYRVLHENVDAFTDGGEAEIEGLQIRLATLRQHVDTLCNQIVDSDRVSDLQDHVLSIEEQVTEVREVLDRQQQEQVLRDQTLKCQLVEVQEDRLKGSKAQSNVLVLARFLKEDLLPAMAAHSHDPVITIYDDQHAIDQMPKCAFCGSPKEGGGPTCSQLECVAKLLSVPQRTMIKGKDSGN